MQPANAMIVAAQPEAAEAGAIVLKHGGNAVDAAIACALVQGVVDPQMCGLAGFGSFQVFDPVSGDHECIDFHAKTPLAAKPDMWEKLHLGETRDGFGFLLEGAVNEIGHQAAATPGALKGYFEAAERFGSWDWADLCQPAIEQARKGFLVRPHVRQFWLYGVGMGRVPPSNIIAYSPTGKDIYFHPDGSLKDIGDHVLNTDLAHTLEMVAQDGADIFYHGEIAERIEHDMKQHGGLMTRADLAAYETSHQSPLEGTYRDYRLATNHPPGGGIMLVEMLNILEHFDLRSLGHNTPDYIRTVAEAMKTATRDKDAHIGDPAFQDVPDFVTNKAYAAQIAEKIRSGEKIHVPRHGIPESRDTTQVCVIDADGRAVTMTHSLGMPCGVIPEGLGFMLNGCMAVFDPVPGRTGSIAPGKSRFSSICPSLVFRDERVEIAIGAPGGTQIAMGVVQALLNLIDFDMSVTEAVSAPRFSATSDIIDIINRIPDYDVQPLRDAGYAVERSPKTFGFGWVHGIRQRPEGVLEGGADPAADGVALPVVAR